MNSVGETKGSALNRIFRVTLYLKGLDGLLELIGGGLLLLVPPNQIGTLVRILTQHELSEDPQDLVANALIIAAHGLTLSASLFGAIYLLLHGFVKVVLKTLMATLPNGIVAINVSSGQPRSAASNQPVIVAG